MAVRTWMMLVAVALGAVSCTSGSSIPGNLARNLRTPQGDEASLTCPPSLEQVADPTKLAEALGNMNIRTPGPPAGLVPADAWTPPGSLGALLPVDPNLKDPGICELNTNGYVGEPGYGFFATEEELEQMGRLCGCERWPDPPAFHVRIDLYESTAGAREGLRREASTIYPQIAPLNIDNELVQRVGQERTLRGTPDDYDRYILLFRRRNVVARLELSYYSKSSPEGQGPVEPLLYYAEQLDRNIEAAANGGAPSP